MAKHDWIVISNTFLPISKKSHVLLLNLHSFQPSGFIWCLFCLSVPCSCTVVVVVFSSFYHPPNLFCFLPLCLLILSCALFYHALSCSDKAVCSFYWCERHPVVISSAVDCYWFMHANVRFRFTCNAAVKEVMFDKTVNFLTDTIRGALPAESKGKGTAGTKPAVPRSASQPGNHVKRGSDMPIILGSHGCFRLFSFLIGCLTVTESFRDIFIECFSILSSFHRRFFWQTWALDYSLSNISHKVFIEWC